LDFVMNKFCRSKSRIHSCNAARANWPSGWNASFDREARLLHNWYL
jgi:hypothetical protein